MTTLYLDTETYCEVPIKHGIHRYAAEAEIILVQWAIDDGPPQASEDILDLPDPAGFDDVVIHNSAFDRHMLAKYGIDIPLEKIRDTFVMALMHSLPGALDKLCDIYKLPVDLAKDKEGKKLVKLFCLPRPKNSKLRRATPLTHPEEWIAFRDVYGLRDVVSMREIYKKLPRWNMLPEEIAMWRLDQQINDRGVQIDMDLVEAAIAMCADERYALADKVTDNTLGVVVSATQRNALLSYISDMHGIDLPDLTSDTIQRFVSDDPLLVELLGLREMAARASPAKYAALKRSTSSDGRLRNTLQYCGAARTGRWSGRIFQPQNLPRPSLPSAEIAVGIDAIKGGWADLITNDRMDLAANALRGVIVAKPGRNLVVADLANIEGRVLAWLANEKWKIKAYEDYDNDEGPDLYTLAYNRAHGLPDATEISRDARQLGKVMELALGYEGGVGAFVAFAATYGINLEDLTAEALPRNLWAQAQEAYAWAKQKKRTYGLTEHVWTTCETIKRAWREAHPETCRLWLRLWGAFQAAATHEQGTVWPAGKLLSARRDGAWVRIVLPSGRSLCYPQPHDNGGKLSYMGTHQWTHQWARIHTYGGKLAENVTQAVARDILRDGMLAASANGFDIALSVHDEIIAEADGADETDLGLDMTALAGWAYELPLAADGFVAERYRK